MRRTLLDDINGLSLSNEGSHDREPENRIHFEDLPQEIISQILRHAIPSWSLRIDRRIRHACRPHQQLAAINNSNLADETKSETSLTYIARPTAPHDLRYLLRINKFISSLVRAEYLHTFTGILEVYRFTIQGEGQGFNIRLESSLTESGCPCFSAEERIDKLRAALGMYARHVRAVRLIESSLNTLDLNLLQILPMAKIAFIDRSSDLTNLSYDSSSLASVLPTHSSHSTIIDFISNGDLIELLWKRWSAYSQRPGSPLHTLWGPALFDTSTPRLYVSKLWEGPVNTLIEAVISYDTVPKVWSRRKPYFYVGFIAKCEKTYKPKIHVLGRYTEEEGEALGENVRLASYLDALRNLE